MLSATLAAACSGESGTGNISWSPASSCARSVTVYAGNTVVESFAFTYDDSGRLSTLVRTDPVSSKSLLDVRYAYEGTSRVMISGSMADDNKDRTIQVDVVKGGLEYSAPQSWKYHVAVSDGMPVSVGTASKFEAPSGVVSTGAEYEERFTEESGDISGHTIGTVFKGETGKGTGVMSEGSLSYHYSYTSDPDRQNFDAFLMECNFAVWYAAGLPGCRHLTSDIKVSGDGVDYQSDQHIDYELDSDGNILSAVRTWKSGSETLLTLKYVFSYE